jgi:hypothetical protein
MMRSSASVKVGDVLGGKRNLLAIGFDAWRDEK